MQEELQVEVHFAASFQKFGAKSRNVVITRPTVSAALEAIFADQPHLRGYVLEDQGSVRKHVTIFLNNETVRDRRQLTDPLRSADQIFVFQALSGG